MHELLRSVTDDELRFIASLDYGVAQDEHYEALKKVLHEQKGLFQEGQYWCPYEVVELGANSVKPGHEREFTICTLLVLQAIISGFDPARDANEMLSARSLEYDKLPQELSKLVLETYESAGC